MSVFSIFYRNNAVTVDPMKLTPVLLVESIEKSLTFWTERMAWQRTVESQKAITSALSLSFERVPN